MAEMCPHDGYPNCCPPCVNGRLGSTVTTDVRTVVATYPGVCDGCHDPIVPGDRIASRWAYQRERTWIHAACADPEALR